MANLNSLLLVTFLVVTATACTKSISSDLLDPCEFSALTVSVAPSSWVLSRQNCGQLIAVEMFESPPVVYFDYGSPEKLYTVVFVDLDGGPTEDKVFLHWIVANVAESTLLQGMTSTDGDTVMDYLAPTVARYEHRYGFYLYEQVYGTSYPPMRDSRAEFDLGAWIGSHHPEGALCGPVASTGFCA
ncbi:uncharacterized protein LOC6042539 [Culex quinquefasciatus]|uniref:uncharacterized protein LOC6042539 n=1 Tax=Culex quinquefasciatus TaxID=7176 RepID=UPI0018E37C24|nr:uncharacterized protein LOC6042539 [Culex quinquefasciatus]